jgi:RND family efflux transporter MFP subunit
MRWLSQVQWSEVMTVGSLKGMSVALLALVVFARPVVAEPLPPMDCVIEPNQVVDLSSAVIGVVKEILVDRGDMVEAGQIVVQLDSGVELAALDYAKARAAANAQLQAEQVSSDFATRRKERLESLYKQQALATDQMDEIATDARLKQLQLKQAAEARRLAELDMRQAEEVAKRHTIRSPVRGVVVQRYLSPGESVENKAIMRIAEIDPLKAEVIIPVAYFGAIKPGRHAVVVPEEPKNQAYPAVVTVVDRVADAASGTFRARLALPNPDYGLPSGLRCSVQFQDASATTPAPPPPAPRPAGSSSAVPALTAPAAPPPNLTATPAPGTSPGPTRRYSRARARPVSPPVLAAAPLPEEKSPN